MRVSKSALKTVSKIFVDDFKELRGAYKPTKYPIVLCHGLLGFDHITLPDGSKFSYFNGVKETLETHGARVIARSVPPIATIQLRANSLRDSLSGISKNIGKVNIIAHSMGGLDARFMISKLLQRADDLQVASLTTLSTPHRGSPIADIFGKITQYFPHEYGAFAQLTTDYVCNEFNRDVLDVSDVQYFSYGAKIKTSPFSPFFLSGHLIQRLEGDNDGMVSVESSKWGNYMGTLDNVDHGDVINMTKIKPRRFLNHNFSSQAMYLHIMDDLAKLGF